MLRYCDLRCHDICALNLILACPGNMIEIETLDGDLLPSGCSPLHVVANSGDVKSLKLLLHSRSVDVDVLDRHGRTPLTVALQNGRFDAAQVLIESGASVGVCFDDVNTISEVLTTTRFCGFLETLIKEDVFIPLSPVSLEPFVHSAAYDGEAEYLQKLLDRYKIDVNSFDNLGQTPLHYASRRNNTDCVEILLKFGANAMLTNPQGSTALHLACIGGHQDVVSLLLQDWVVADIADLINAQDSQGRTPLHIVLYYKKLELFDHLITNFRHILNFTLFDDSGYTIPALTYTVKVDSRFGPDYRKILHILSSEEACWLLFEGVVQKDLELVQHSIANGATVDCLDYMQQTPLLLASKVGDLEIIEALIIAGANPNVCDAGGKTALQYACELGRFDIANYLLSLEQLNLTLFFNRYNNPLTPELLASLIEHIEGHLSRKPRNWRKWLALSSRNPSIPINLFNQLVSTICPNDWVERLAYQETLDCDDSRTHMPATKHHRQVLQVLTDEESEHKQVSQVYDKLRCKRMSLRKRKQLAKKIGGQFACMRQRLPTKIFTSCTAKQPSDFVHKTTHNIPFHCHFKRDFKKMLYPVHEAARYGHTVALEYFLSNIKQHSLSLLKQLLVETRDDCGQTVAEIIAQQYQAFQETVVKLDIGEVVLSAISDIWPLCTDYSTSLLHYIVSGGKDVCTDRCLLWWTLGSKDA